jgi:hypothetical protein
MSVFGTLRLPNLPTEDIFSPHFNNLLLFLFPPSKSHPRLQTLKSQQEFFYFQEAPCSISEAVYRSFHSLEHLQILSFLPPLSSLYLLAFSVIHRTINWALSPHQCDLALIQSGYQEHAQTRPILRLRGLILYGLSRAHSVPNGN